MMMRQQVRMRKARMMMMRRMKTPRLRMRKMRMNRKQTTRQMKIVSPGQVDFSLEHFFNTWEIKKMTRRLMKRNKNKKRWMMKMKRMKIIQKVQKKM